jgi:hypothetical protein
MIGKRLTVEIHCSRWKTREEADYLNTVMQIPQTRPWHGQMRSRWELEQEERGVEGSGSCQSLASKESGAGFDERVGADQSQHCNARARPTS